MRYLRFYGGLLALSLGFGTPAEAVKPIGARHILDSFEQGNRWENKEWGDSAKLDIVADAATDGKNALRVTFTPDGSRGQKKIVLRRPITGYVQDLKTVSVDIFNPMPAKGMELALAIEADQYYETQALKLEQGWNRNLTFKIDDQKLKSSTTNWEFRGGIPRDVKLGTLVLLVHTGDWQAGAVYVDNLRTDGPVPSMAQRRVAARIDTRPELGEVKILKAPQEIYDRLELGVSFSARYHDPYNPREIALEARFRSPSGQTFDVDGFLYQGNVTLTAPVEQPDWRIRFTPMEVGTWTYQVKVTNQKGQSQGPEQNFTVKAGKKNGFLRVDAKDRDYFSFDSGRFYYPLGQNAAWDSLENYQKMIPIMAENGQNWTRFWMSHWSFGIEWRDMGHYKGLGNYNLVNAKKLDDVMDLLEKHDIYTQLVFEFHGAFSSKVNPEWPNNPYNAEQGGMLKRAQDFFTDPNARELYKQRIRYIVARWGYSPNIMAWEFFNEINFADDFSLKNDYVWHKEMASWLRDLDPYKHLITTSYYDFYNKDTYALPTIDFTQYHAYHRRVWKTMEQVVPRFQRFGKPFFFGEFGSDSADGVDARDKQGIFLRAGLWAQAMQPVGGNAMPWWWNTHIEPNKLYKHFAALARFLDGIDRRGMELRPIREDWPVKMAKHEEKLAYYGLQNKNFAMGWIADSKGKHRDDRASPQTFNGVQFYVRDLEPGRYRIEYWDSMEGRIVEQDEIKVDTSRQALVTLPPFKNDVAFKVKAF